MTNQGKLELIPSVLHLVAVHGNLQYVVQRAVNARSRTSLGLMKKKPRKTRAIAETLKVASSVHWTTTEEDSRIFNVFKTSSQTMNALNERSSFAYNLQSKDTFMNTNTEGLAQDAHQWTSSKDQITFC